MVYIVVEKGDILVVEDTRSYRQDDVVTVRLSGR